jgi:CHASE2 domain-containing sensor protein
VVLTSLVVTGGVALGRFLGFLEPLEIAAYDSFMVWQPDAPTDDRILVVGISEADIQNLEEYPITDGTVVALLEALGRHEPRAIGLDIARDFPQGAPADWVQLNERLASSDRIISACLMSSEQFPGVAPAPGASEASVAFADFPQDRDGVLRRTLLVSLPGEFQGQESVRSHLCNQPDPEAPLLSLSFLMALIYLEDEGIFTEQTEAGDVVWEGMVVRSLSEWSGGYAGTGAVDYQVMLNYRAPREAVRQVSLMDILEERVDPAWIEDRLVLVGYTSPVANDIHITPYPETTAGLRGMPGVVVHAQATSQLISGGLDGRPLIQSWPEVVEIALIALWGMVAGTVAYYLRRWGWLAIAILGLTAALWGIAYGAFLQGLWLPVVPMAGAGLLTAIIVSLVIQARKSVYAQAIFEQLKAEMTGRMAQKSASSRRDRLDELVRRAQAIRQRQAIGDVLEGDDLQRLKADPLHMEFDSPEVQSFYEQIKAQLQQQFDAEKALLETQVQQRGSSKSAKLQALLQKSQSTRSIRPLPNSQSDHNHE